MRPLQQYHRQNAHGMNFRKEVLLDALSETPCTVQTLMDSCMEINLASQATLHREIHEMIELGLIDYQVNKYDRRVAQLKLTGNGKRYLRKLK